MARVIPSEERANECPDQSPADSPVMVWPSCLEDQYVLAGGYVDVVVDGMVGSD